jgi:perosamine synthetase
VVMDYDCYRDHPRVLADAVPNASWIASRCISLPVHAALTECDVEHIVDSVIDAVGGG